MNSSIGLTEASGAIVALPVPNNQLPASRARVNTPRISTTENTDDDDKAIVGLLAKITKAAKAVIAKTDSLRELVQEACDNDVDRDDVIDAIIEGGWAEQTARNMVSAIYNLNGKRVKAKGQGRKGSKLSPAICKLVKEAYPDCDLVKELLAASRYAKRK